MWRNILIRRLLAGILLLLFALSNMPRQTLHQLFANHTDTTHQPTKADTKNTGEQQLSKSGFHCQCLNLVVENPYVQNAVNIDFCDHCFSTNEIPAYQQVFYSADKNLHALRGPPSFA